MPSKEVEEFQDAAARYCDLVDSYRLFLEAEWRQKLLFSLSTLYVKALALPDVESEVEQPGDLKFPRPLVEFEVYDAYTMIFDPYQDKEPVIGLLSDDVSDIYVDVMRGLLLYKQGDFREAVWEWNFSFEVHWGKHATSAIHALHSRISL